MFIKIYQVYFQMSGHQNQERKDPLLPLIKGVTKVNEKVLVGVADGLVVSSFLPLKKDVY